MPLTSIPAIDANICSGWTEQQVDLYNKLPFYLAKMQVDYRSTWATWKKFLGTKKWQRNMGDTMKGVIKEPSPHVRQVFTPALLSAAPKKDVIQVRERTATTQVRKHRHESLTLNFVPDFQDFLTDHVDAAGEDLLEKQTRAEDIFYRTQIFYQSPKIRVCGDTTGNFFQNAPMDVATEAYAAGVTTLTGVNAKSSAWNQARIAELGAAGNLGMLEMNRIITAAETDERIRPYSGTDIPKQDQGLSGKFCFVMPTEAFNALTFDPYLQQNKNCQLDVVNGRFQGSLFGRATCILEDKAMQMTEAGTLAAPETVVLDPNAFNYGESIPNPQYTTLDDTGSPYGWAFLVGAQGYDALEIGPPPAAFASNGMPKGFGKMFWNGEIMLTKNFQIPCPTDDNPNAMELNTYGEYIKFISQTVYGILGKQRRNIIPILYKRTRGA